MSDADSPVARQANDDFDDDAHQDAGHQSDRDSDNLSEIDEDQFDDYDPNNEDKPIDIDENVALTLKAAKRKRVDTEAPKKPKEGRRPSKRARAADADVEMGDGSGDQARRPRKSRTDGEERRAAKKEAAAAAQEQENEENLTPEERKRRALDRAIDEAVKGGKNKRRRKKDDIVGDRWPLTQSPELFADPNPRTWKTRSITRSLTSRSPWRRPASTTTRHAKRARLLSRSSSFSHKSQLS